MTQNSQIHSKYKPKSKAVAIFYEKYQIFWWNFCVKCLWPKIVISDFLCEFIPRHFSLSVSVRFLQWFGWSSWWKIPTPMCPSIKGWLRPSNTLTAPWCSSNLTFPNILFWKTMNRINWISFLFSCGICHQNQICRPYWVGSNNLQAVEV